MGQCCCIENNTPSIELTDFRSQSEYNEARKTKSFKVKNEEAKSKLDRVGRKSINTREYEKPQKKVKLRVSITPETQLGKLMHDKTGFRYFHKFLREKNLLMWFDCYVSLLEYEEIPTEEYKQAYSRKIINKVSFLFYFVDYFKSISNKVMITQYIYPLLLLVKNSVL